MNFSLLFEPYFLWADEKKKTSKNVAVYKNVILEADYYISLYNTIQNIDD